MASTFSAYHIAKSGIQTAQYYLKVTGQNVSNVYTDGYTRQRLDTYAVAPTGLNGRYASKGDLAIGGGVDASGVTQLRDPYLDVRYRMEHSKTGLTGTELDTMDNVQDIFDEITKNGINTQLTDLTKQLNTLAASPSDSNLETIVKNSALLLTKAFKNASEQLSKIRSQETGSFQSGGIDKVNNILQNIAQLNREIKSSDISEAPALELRDQRNSLLDELSQYFDIQVTSSKVPIGAGRTVEEMQVSLVSGDKKVTLVSNDQYNQFKLDTDPKTVEDSVEDGAGDSHVYASKTINASVTLTDSNGNVLKGSDGTTPLVTNDDLKTGVFGGYLAMLNDSGEYDAVPSKTFGTGADEVTSPATASTTRGIGYYEKVLDQFASELSKTMNGINSTDGANNKPMFSNGGSDSSKPITAANISISDQWNNATGSYITATKNDELPGVDNSSAGKNILYMVYQFSQEQTYKTPEDVTVFSTSLNSYVSKISTTLGLDIETATRQNDTYNSNLDGIDTQRASISSVDVNEEVINMTAYNQSLAASSRFMTTIDEAIDTIINKMGIVGR